MFGSPYHRSVKLVQTSPLFVAGVHDIYLLVIEGSFRPDILDDGFCRVAQAAWGSGEEGDAASEQTGSGAEHVGDWLTTTHAVTTALGVQDRRARPSGRDVTPKMQSSRPRIKLALGPQ